MVWHGIEQKAEPLASSSKVFRVHASARDRLFSDLSRCIFGQVSADYYSFKKVHTPKHLSFSWMRNDWGLLMIRRNKLSFPVDRNRLHNQRIGKSTLTDLQLPRLKIVIEEIAVNVFLHTWIVDSLSTIPAIIFLNLRTSELASFIVVSSFVRAAP
jgi:hypothetical protein